MAFPKLLQKLFENAGAGPKLREGVLPSVTAKGTTTARELQERFADSVNVKDFGAIGDGVTDDTASIRAAYAHALTGGQGSIYFPAGKYLISSPLDFFRTSKKNSGSVFDDAKNYDTISLVGETMYSSQLVAGFADPSRAVIECLGETRCAPLSIYNLGFTVADTVDETLAPGYVWVNGHGNSFLENVQFLGGRNVHFRSLSAQNVRLDNVLSWYGGFCWGYNDTAGISGTIAAQKLVASSAIFSSSDVGRKITISSPTAGIRQFTISAYTNATTVTVAESVGDISFSWLMLESAKCTFTAGSDTIVANASCFKSTDVGRTIFIQRALSDSNGNGLHRCQIVGIDSSNANVAYVSPAPTVSGNGFFSQAAIEFSANEGVYSWDKEDSSDVKATMLHIEHYSGVGLVVKNCNSYNIINSKIHGETFTAKYSNGTFPPANVQSSAAAWLDAVECDFEIDFDTLCASNGAYVYASRQKGTMTFADVHARLVPDQLLIQEEAYSGKGAIIVNGVYTKNVRREPNNLFDGASIKLVGVLCSGYEVDTRHYLTNTSVVDENNVFAHGGSITAQNSLSISGLAPVVEITNRSVSKTWQVNTNYGNFYIKDATVGTNRLAIHTSTGNVFPPSSNTSSIGQANGLWSQLFAASATINTSDARLKANVTDPDEALMRAWGKVDIKSFQFTDALEKKGDDARVHFGVIAQQVQEAFASEGLDASRYALFCYDKWDDEYEEVEVVDVEAVMDEQGNEIAPSEKHTELRLVTPAGDRYGIRYSEALALECAYQRWRLAKIEERLG